jgi:hypothetical protein
MYVSFEHPGHTYGGFGSVSQNRGVTLDYLKIHGVLKHDKGPKGIKGPRWKKTKQEAKVTKTRLSGYSYRNTWFYQNKWSPSRV